MKSKKEARHCFLGKPVNHLFPEKKEGQMHSKKKISLEDVQKILPYNEDAEIGCLKACLSDSSATDRARKFVTPQDFYKIGGQLVFEKLCQFREQSRDYTPSLIIDAFRGTNEFDKIDALIQEIGPFFTGEACTHFAKIILEQSLRRSLVHATYRANQCLFDQSVSVGESIQSLQKALDEARGRMVE